VVAAEAATRELTADGAPSEDELLPDTTTRLEIGSIAASLLADAMARALFVSVTAAVDITDAEVHDYRERNPRRFGSAAQIAEHLRSAARRREFRRWLDARCAELVELAPGYEHPGDPRQPDNTHRH
jgi:[acyl-carrier-protein] S-malonyltransferase